MNKKIKESSVKEMISDEKQSEKERVKEENAKAKAIVDAEVEKMNEEVAEPSISNAEVHSSVAEVNVFNKQGNFVRKYTAQEHGQGYRDLATLFASKNDGHSVK